MKTCRPETAEAERIIRAIAATYTHDPAALDVLIIDETPLGVTFDLQTSEDDHRKLIGKNGANIRALSLICSTLFPDSETGYRIVHPIREPKAGERKRFMPTVRADRYDPDQAVEKLCTVLSKMLVDNFVVEVEHGSSVDQDGMDVLAYVFRVVCSDEDDHDFLNGVGLGAGLKPVAALDTLWRAFGNKDGVSFKIETRER